MGRRPGAELCGAEHGAPAAGVAIRTARFWGGCCTNRPHFENCPPLFTCRKMRNTLRIIRKAKRKALILQAPGSAANINCTALPGKPPAGVSHVQETLLLLQGAPGQLLSHEVTEKFSV